MFGTLPADSQTEANFFYCEKNHFYHVFHYYQIDDPKRQKRRLFLTHLHFVRGKKVLCAPYQVNMIHKGGNMNSLRNQVGLS